LLVIDQSYTTARILDTTVVDMVPVSDQSFYLRGRDLGRTLVKFFDAKGVALVDLYVTVGAPLPARWSSLIGRS
jgi:Flp pilus assembly secretin CpaC